MKTTGALIKAFWADPTIFDEEEETIERDVWTVNGVEYEEGEGPDVESLADDDVVKVSHGEIIKGLDWSDPESLDSRFKKWLKRQKQIPVVVVIDKDRLEDFLKLVDAFGGKVKK